MTMTMTEATTLVQAISAAVAAGVTIALWRVTTRYAAATDGMLAAMRQEREDRLAAARAPAINATYVADEVITRVEYAMRDFKDESKSEAERLGSVTWLRDMGLTSLAGRIAQSSALIAYAPLRAAVDALNGAAVNLLLVFPRTPGQDQPPLSLSEIRVQLEERVPQHLAALRAAKEAALEEARRFSG